MTRSLTVRAAAKINLHLGVGAPREDGFHPLDTVYQAVSLYDDLTAYAADDWSLTTAVAAHLGEVELPAAGDNIVDRVAELLCARRCDDGCRPTARVEVSKTIPVAGGMAGGSADAAAALVALDRLWDLRTPDSEMLALAAELGSDVPFSLIGGTARGVGRGELVTPTDDFGAWSWVVVPDDRGLSTPAVFRHFDALFPDASPEPAPAQPVLTALASGDPVALAAALHNDLEAAAVDLRPDLGDLLARGESEGALRGLVSGSGPTCVFLCESAEAARDVAASLASTRPVVLTAHGPVAGAHVVDTSPFPEN
ncbi:4-(cytidine 5'-diphospho)-2-C-methyl-D-erythritol kinase [Nocardioides jishulii]|uniref:4-diphosphocytidyl-2-C-methyl-D-erythritol kinase n=1 Tax=Nocardioides jishulii TaxID=2575440 RepID=A0A4U2YWN4_9ACTN|nr:4-(cytidine 5'-diphospho)-2-C-methyl-D-erythritol kinase [Nocardioides jishulii]QCX28526.1 4-(cytidine 5'-diphospho)-2-C-methyl-D-erythritol kinase [Nocardioides jishulii]TKI64581.1 4-(cytidine 5'-diphospho)-2-C-methyl-D-erythritol kinase [Nocardioides jishulii]